MKSLLLVVSALSFAVACDKNDRPVSASVDGNSSGINEPNPYNNGVDAYGNPVNAKGTCSANNSTYSANNCVNSANVGVTSKSGNITGYEAQVWFSLLSKANNGNVVTSGNVQTVSSSLVSCPAAQTTYNYSNANTCVVTGSFGNVYTTDVNESAAVVATFTNSLGFTSQFGYKAQTLTCQMVSQNQTWGQTNYDASQNTYSCNFVLEVSNQDPAVKNYNY
jgi:hypothetical protein